MDKKVTDPTGYKLKEERVRRGLSAAQAAKELRLPLANIYKWETGKATPKYEDRVKILKWIGSGDSNNFPDAGAAGISFHSEEPAKVIPAAASFTEKYIAELQDRIQELKQDKEDLKREKETLYNLLNTNLHALASTQQITQAQLKALIKWSVDESAGRDKQKSIQSLAKINKLVADLIPTSDDGGKNHGGI